METNIVPIATILISVAGAYFVSKAQILNTKRAERIDKLQLEFAKFISECCNIVYSAASTNEDLKAYATQAFYIAFLLDRENENELKLRRLVRDAVKLISSYSQKRESSKVGQIEYCVDECGDQFDIVMKDLRARLHWMPFQR